MIQTATRFRRAFDKLAALVSLLAALAVPIDDSVAADSGSGPTIASVDVGIKGYFKVGSWTSLRVEISGAQGLKKPRIEVTVPDSDGVPTTVSAPLQAARSIAGAQTAVAFTKVGRIGSSIEVSLIDGDRRLDERTIRPDKTAKQSSAAISLSPTSEFLVSLGAAPLGLEHAFPDRDSEGGQLARQFVELKQVADLPTEWFGYESVDVLFISAGDGKLCRELAADAPRYEALARWVELGGRLVILCDGQTAEPLFAKDGPLAKFAPGKFTEVVRLRETGPLEHFAGTAPTISLGKTSALPIPRFVDIAGNIELYAGRRASDLPIVVRSPHGLGEIAFVGVDLSQPPLSEWSGRAAFLQALVRPYLPRSSSGDASQRLVTRGYNDLSGALRQRLGQSFASVVPIGFAVVAGLAIAYMIFLGPLDYLFINRWIRRPWVAWITFPLIVLVFCAGAMSLSNWRNGQAGLRANQLVLIDIDTMTGRARGTYWASLFSPSATRLNLTFQPSAIAAEMAGKDNALFSWWGLPGVGIGGMQSGGLDLGIVHGGYRYGPDRRSLEGVPLLASATKSLMARWTAAAAVVEADLTDQDGLAVGTIANHTGQTLRNVRLLFGSWAYRLGNLKDGQRMDVGEQLSPRKVKTIVTHDVLDESGGAKTSIEGRTFVAEQASAKEILSLMMFYEAAGGFPFAHLPNRFQAFCDLSRLLELGRAILVADADGPVSQLLDTATGNAIGDKQGESTVIYRFVLPVKRIAAL